MSLLGVLWHDDPHDDVRYQAGEATWQQQDKGDETDDHRINVEVFCQSAANTGDFSILLGAVESLVHKSSVTPLVVNSIVLCSAADCITAH